MKQKKELPWYELIPVVPGLIKGLVSIFRRTPERRREKRLADLDDELADYRRRSVLPKDDPEHLSREDYERMKAEVQEQREALQPTS